MKNMNAYFVALTMVALAACGKDDNKSTGQGGASAPATATDVAVKNLEDATNYGLTQYTLTVSSVQTSENGKADAALNNFLLSWTGGASANVFGWLSWNGQDESELFLLNKDAEAGQKGGDWKLRDHKELDVLENATPINIPNNMVADNALDFRFALTSMGYENTEDGEKVYAPWRIILDQNFQVELDAEQLQLLEEAGSVEFVVETETDIVRADVDSEEPVITAEGVEVTVAFRLEKSAVMMERLGITPEGEQIEEATDEEVAATYSAFNNTITVAKIHASENGTADALFNNFLLGWTGAASQNVFAWLGFGEETVLINKGAEAGKKGGQWALRDKTELDVLENSVPVGLPNEMLAENKISLDFTLASMHWSKNQLDEEIYTPWKLIADQTVELELSEEQQKQLSETGSVDVVAVLNTDIVSAADPSNVIDADETVTVTFRIEAVSQTIERLSADSSEESDESSSDEEGEEQTADEEATEEEASEEEAA